MNLTTDAGVLNLAGVLLFAERPEWIKPQFVVNVSAAIRKCIFFSGLKMYNLSSSFSCFSS
jgi:hypothetical protein